MVGVFLVIQMPDASDKGSVTVPARPIGLASVIRHKARLRSWGTLTMPPQCLPTSVYIP